MTGMHSSPHLLSLQPPTLHASAGLGRQYINVGHIPDTPHGTLQNDTFRSNTLFAVAAPILCILLHTYKGDSCACSASTMTRYLVLGIFRKVLGFWDGNCFN